METKKPTPADSVYVVVEGYNHVNWHEASRKLVFRAFTLLYFLQLLLTFYLIFCVKFELPYTNLHNIVQVLVLGIPINSTPENKNNCSHHVPAPAAAILVFDFSFCVYNNIISSYTMRVAGMTHFIPKG